MESEGIWSDVAAAQPHVAPNCPRCASANTKFCYYNNYSLAQPRYFCKSCRRYWTKGGSLRNVPVGGGCRKSRRSRSRAHRNNTPHAAPDNNNNSSSSSSSGQSGSGPDIDMAAVFARYVSQEAPKKVVDGDTCADVVTTTWQDDDVDLESFDYEMLVTDDCFWSTADGSTANWEAMAPLEEMDSSPAVVMDEEFVGSPNSVNDLLVNDASWNCFDLAGYGDFYRP
ncbi:hypothetical protein V2J09_007665 [Rumex salicifolius]